MKPETILQLSQILPEGDPKAVFNEIERIYWYNYSPASFKTIKRSYKQIARLFKGGYPGYKACNTEYHNLEHTLDAMLAAIRLIDGHNQKGKPLSEIIARNCLIATLFHDTGYIQEQGDDCGTGAKYTSNHVERSIAFLVRNHLDFSVEERDMESISNIIKCTGLSVDMKSINFGSADEFTVGKVLGASDLLGQMSQREYLEKLLFLYYEFKGANIPGFNTEFDILKKTIDFYEIVKGKLVQVYDSVHLLAQEHFKKRFEIDSNLYMNAIEKNIAYLQKIIDDESTNFRNKLKRGDWISLEKTKSQSHVQ